MYAPGANVYQNRVVPKRGGVKTRQQTGMALPEKCKNAKGQPTHSAWSLWRRPENTQIIRMPGEAMPSNDTSQPPGKCN